MSFPSERFSNRFDTVVNEFRRWNLVAQQMWIPYSITYYVPPTREDLISSPLFRYSTACWIDIYRQVDWRDISALFEVDSDNLDDLIDAVSARLESYRRRGPCSYTFIRQRHWENRMRYYVLANEALQYVHGLYEQVLEKANHLACIRLGGIKLGIDDVEALEDDLEDLEDFLRVRRPMTEDLDKVSLMWWGEEDEDDEEEEEEDDEEEEEEEEEA